MAWYVAACTSRSRQTAERLVRPQVSIGFLLSNPQDAVIWRGPKKNGMIKQFLRDVYWGDELDFLVVDCPPGTSDEHLSVTQVPEYRVQFSIE